MTCLDINQNVTFITTTIYTYTGIRIKITPLVQILKLLVFPCSQRFLCTFDLGVKSFLLEGGWLADEMGREVLHPSHYITLEARASCVHAGCPRPHQLHATSHLCVQNPPFPPPTTNHLSANTNVKFIWRKGGKKGTNNDKMKPYTTNNIDFYENQKFSWKICSLLLYFWSSIVFSFSFHQISNMIAMYYISMKPKKISNVEY